MKTIILTILDGWGISESEKNNAIFQANIPNIKRIEKEYPICSLQASGIAIGLPWNEAGNSEVGHLTIGAGKTIYQYLPRISLEIKNKKFFNNPAFIKAIHHVRQNSSTLHLMGLISSGNVHSYLEHIYALLDLAEEQKIKNLRLHLFTDGKDAPLKESKQIIEDLEKQLKENWKIASVIGRFYAMDRNKSWHRTEKTYNLMTKAIGEKTNDISKKIQEYYDQEKTDTYIPAITTEQGIVKDNDAIIFFNFREDSARQLTEAFTRTKFTKFKREKINNLLFCAMTQYREKLNAEIAYPPIEIQEHLTKVLSKEKKKVLKISETEKYAHVTYFFNAGKEKPYSNETRKLIPSKIVSHYDKHPEMQAEKITQEVLKGIDKYDVIIVNYANTDMIAHTGNMKAAIKAAEIVDENLKPLIDLAEQNKCILLITSDHGNAEQMIDLKTGEKLTEHTINPVPFYLVGEEYKLIKPKTEQEIKDIFKYPEGILSDISPTILELLNIKKPEKMTGKSLLGVVK